MAERYYFDTNALYAFYRDGMSLTKHPNYKHYQDMKGGPIVVNLVKSSATTIYVSNLIYLEFLGVLMRHERTQRSGKWELKRKEVDCLIERLKEDIGTTARHYFQLVPTMDGVFQEARTLIIEHARRGQCALGTNDALHIAIAKLMQPKVILVTSDGGGQRGDTFAKMKCVCQRIGLEFFDPEEF
jgi:predicted nucleic acid-binding protein